MVFREYNFIIKRITKSLSILVNKEETNLLKFYFIYFENQKLIFCSHIPEAAVRRCSVKKVSIEILQNSLKNTLPESLF